MNIFRLIGDMTHVLSFIALLLKLWGAKNATGISVKTQELFLLVFCTRYLDLFTNFFSVYNTCMKILYIVLSGGLVYLLHFVEPFKTTAPKAHDLDVVQHWKILVAPCAVLALIINEAFEPMEILWTFSIYLEAVAIIPQIYVLMKSKDCDNITSHYIVLLGSYRFFYILNWIYRAMYEPYYHSHWIVYISGVIQTVLYADFFYYYYLSWRSGDRKIKLPV